MVARARTCFARLEQDALGRGGEAFLCRLGGMARHATRLDHRLDFGEGGRRPDVDSWPRQRGKRRQHEHHQTRGQHQRVGIALMALHEPDSHQGTRDRNHDQQHPVPLVAVEAGVVVADHGEQHGQGEIGIVDRALAAHQPVLWIRRAALLLGLHQFALAGNDHEVDVEHHDHAEHGAEMQVGAAAGKEVAQRPGRACAEEKEQPAQDGVVLAQGRAAQPVVEQPAAHHEGEADGDRLALVERHHGGIDQGHLGAVVVDEAEQQEARDQGGVGLPHEPVQVGRQRLGGDRELLGGIEAAAVDRPDLAADPLGPIGRVERLVQVIVQPDEVERGPDPGDAHDHVGPSKHEIQPIAEETGIHALS